MPFAPKIVILVVKQVMHYLKASRVLVHGPKAMGSNSIDNHLINRQYNI